MKFGIFTFITDDGTRPDDLGRAIEERGFESLFTAEHSHIPAIRESPYPGGGELPEMYYRSLDQFSALMAAAVVTENLLVGTGINLLIQNDAIVTAKQGATLDLVSRGRFIFGVGAGWNREEMRNHGTDPKTRGQLLNEKIDAIKAIWTTEPAEYHGKHVDFDPIFSKPKPVQTPHPPIYVGGNSDAALRRAVDHGNGWLANPLQVPDMTRQFAKLRDYAGRDVPVSVVGSPQDKAVVEAYQALGVERVAFFLNPGSLDETLRDLDKAAAFVSSLG